MIQSKSMLLIKQVTLFYRVTTCLALGYDIMLFCKKKMYKNCTETP